MQQSREAGITRMLEELQNEPERRDEINERLYGDIYPQLRAIAKRMMVAERRDHTLQATALVHEAYVHLVDQSRAVFRNRAHFLAIAARVMRRVLIDHARHRQRIKRGGGMIRVTLAGDIARRDLDPLELLALDQVLRRLESLHARIAQVVEQRVFGGMTMQEIATAADVSLRTVHDDWSFARRWLALEMGARDHES